MSTTLAELHNTGPLLVSMSITRFSGGVKKGLCVQLTAKMEDGRQGCIQLTKDELDLANKIFSAHEKLGGYDDYSEEENAFYVTIASNQPFGCGYFKVYADSLEQAEEKIFAVLGDRWAFMYRSLEEVHELDRKEHGIIY